MEGFDSEFKNLKDYILKITYRIWEERGVERIRDYYGEKAPVKTPTSVSEKVEESKEPTTKKETKPIEGSPKDETKK